MNTGVYQRNLSSLKKTNSMLAANLLNTVKSRRVSFRKSKIGEMVPVIDTGLREIPVHSLVDPIKEGIRFANGHTDNGYFIFLGIGAAYHITPFLDNPKITNLILIDSSIDVLKSIMSEIDLSRLILDPRTDIFVAPMQNEVKEHLLGTYAPFISGPLTTIPLRSVANFEKVFFQKIREEIEYSIHLIRTDSATQAKFGKLWFKNTALNLERLVQSRTRIASVSNAIITGAGPSLEFQIPKLRSLQKTNFLIAVDTSLPALLANDIVPDCVISIDCQHISYLHFMQGFPHNTPIVMDIGSPPLLTRISAPVIFFASGNPFSRYISENWVPFPSLDTSGGNVTQSALSLAIRLNAGVITVFGADYCFLGGKTYSRGTYIYSYFDTISSRIRSRESQHAAFMYGANPLISESADSGMPRYSTLLLQSYRRELRIFAERMNFTMEAMPDNVLVFKRSHRKISRGNPNYFGVNPQTVIKDKTYTDLLSNFVNGLKSLSELKLPLTTYYNNMNVHDRSLWNCIYPVAASLSNAENRAGTFGIDLLEDARAWAIAMVENILNSRISQQ
jgi:hypothetical protein